MIRFAPCRTALLCLAGILALPAAQAASGGQTPTCYVNRYGVEKCGSDGNNGGDKYFAADSASSTTAAGSADAASPHPTPSAQQRLQRYCAEQKKAGKSNADGLCANLTAN
jgi:hypothetical protein